MFTLLLNRSFACWVVNLLVLFSGVMAIQLTNRLSKTVDDVVLVVSQMFNSYNRFVYTIHSEIYSVGSFFMSFCLIHSMQAYRCWTIDLYNKMVTTRILPHSPDSSIRMPTFWVFRTKNTLLVEPHKIKLVILLNLICSSTRQGEIVDIHAFSKQAVTWCMVTLSHNLKHIKMDQVVVLAMCVSLTDS